MIQKRSAAEIVAEREALESLLASEGWAIFEKGVREEWTGAGYFSRMGLALSKTDPLAPKVVHETSLEIMRLFQKLRDRANQLKALVNE